MTLRLSVGTYEMIQGVGEIWYGNQYVFGNNASYQKGTDPIVIERNYEYTLTLYGVENGNYGTQNIPFPYGNK